MADTNVAVLAPIDSGSDATLRVLATNPVSPNPAAPVTDATVTVTISRFGTVIVSARSMPFVSEVFSDDDQRIGAYVCSLALAELTTRGIYDGVITAVSAGKTRKRRFTFTVV